MIFCPRCQSPCQPGSRFCATCGLPFTARRGMSPGAIVALVLGIIAGLVVLALAVPFFLGLGQGFFGG
jgi:hypothetical protein